MRQRNTGKPFIVAILLMAFTSTCLQVPAYAAVMTTQEIVAQQALQADRDQLRQRLLREDVTAELVALGVSPDAVSERINSLTATELAEMNGKLDALPAGGNVLGTIVLVLLILILLEITGAIDIFPKI